MAGQEARFKFLGDGSQGQANDVGLGGRQQSQGAWRFGRLGGAQGSMAAGKTARRAAC